MVTAFVLVYCTSDFWYGKTPCCLCREQESAIDLLCILYQPPIVFGQLRYTAVYIVSVGSWFWSTKILVCLPICFHLFKLNRLVAIVIPEQRRLRSAGVVSPRKQGKNHACSQKHQSTETAIPSLQRPRPLIHYASACAVKS